MRALLLVAAAAVLMAAGAGEPAGTVILTGRVTVRGNEPHTMVVIASTQKGDVQITGPLAEEIRARHQGRVLELRCRMVRDAARPGFPAAAEALKILDIKG